MEVFGLHFIRAWEWVLNTRHAQKLSLLHQGEELEIYLCPLPKLEAILLALWLSQIQLLIELVASARPERLWVRAPPGLPVCHQEATSLFFRSTRLHVLCVLTFLGWIGADPGEVNFLLYAVGILFSNTHSWKSSS